MTNNSLKRCRKCGHDKPADEGFYRRSGNTCRECVNRKAAAWHRAHPQRTREIGRASFARRWADPAKRRDIQAQRRLSSRRTRERRRAHRRKFYRANRDRLLAKRRAYDAAHRDEIRERMRRWRARRAAAAQGSRT